MMPASPPPSANASTSHQRRSWALTSMPIVADGPLDADTEAAPT